MQQLARHTTSCIFEAREVFLLPSLEVDELFLELEERRLTEPLEQTTSSEKDTRDVLPELGADRDEEPEVVDERRLHEREGRLSVPSTGTTTGLSFEQVAQLATLSLASLGGPDSEISWLVSSSCDDNGMPTLVAVAETELCHS